MSEFIHLHNHSQFSIGDGHCTVERYVEESARRGAKAVAITDHGNMAGAVNLYKLAKENGLKPIVGCEFYVDWEERPNYPNHITILAMNENGYRDLITAVSLANANFYYRPRMSLGVLAERGLMKDWVVLTGCRRSLFDAALLAGDEKTAMAIWDTIQRHAGLAYVEVMVHSSDDNEVNETNRFLREKKIASGLPLVLTNDCHYLTKEDEEAHQDWARKANEHGEHVIAFNEKDLYFRSSDEMFALAAEVGLQQAALNTEVIAGLCDLKIPEVDTLSWSVPVVAQDPVHEIHRIVWSIVQPMSGEYQERYNREMRVLDSAPHIAQSYLVAYELVSWCKKHEIPVFCRGSMAGSLVSWLLGITHDDPIEYNLMFERAVNPARPTIPDFDIDVSSDKRGFVLEHIMVAYPDSQPICSYSRYSPRGATKFVLKGLGHSFQEANKISRQIPEDWEENYQTHVPAEALAAVNTFRGVLGSVSIHPAGIVLAGPDRNILREVPKTWVASSKQVGAQYDMYNLKALGLFKLDVLGLRTLDQLARMKQLTDIDPLDRYDDPDVLALFAKGMTAEVFQFDGYAARSVLKDIGVHNFEDLIAANALARPGANIGVSTYKNSESALLLAYPELQSVLGYSRGAMLYQEQAMETCRIIAGFDEAQQDDIKEATKYFRAEVFDGLESIFMEGCRNNGVDGRLAWDSIKRFAGYAFNRAHAMSYAGLAYRMAWYKQYYPAAFYTAVFDDCEDKTRLLLEGHLMDIHWVLPNIAAASFETKPSDENSKELIVGFSSIKGIGDKVWEAIKAALPVKDEADFMERVSKKCNSKHREILRAAGVFGKIEDIGKASELLGFNPLATSERFLSEELCRLEENAVGGFIIDSYEFPGKNDQMSCMLKLAMLGTEIRVLLDKQQWQNLKKAGAVNYRAARFAGRWDRQVLIAEHCDVY